MSKAEHLVNEFLDDLDEPYGIEACANDLMRRYQDTKTIPWEAFDLATSEYGVHHDDWPELEDILLSAGYTLLDRQGNPID